MQPKLQTSTFDEILGGLGPCTNTSGGRYLRESKTMRVELVHVDRSLPVGAGALRCQVHAMFRIVGVFAHLLAQTEIGYFDFAAARAGAEKNVGRFQIEMNHRWFDTSIEITECADSLHHHRPRFLLGNQFMLLEEEVDIVAFDVFENRAEPD